MGAKVSFLHLNHDGMIAEIDVVAIEKKAALYDDQNGIRYNLNWKNPSQYRIEFDLEKHSIVSVR